ncbi:putative Esterase [Taphrina deformans PYCC 5710]|uniref:S-formylglutathione hydrolase n=1 Tax=Taphrina deformans (strain PYCC 5710 / ATCC 11124 / CBS 356.35 / IMI 108563 / JCM 9778 / NBRC 8474) TaxID=1097556 RepID=R4XEM2_TAPDE|nr:putative Esterase [Taphrina deformans PYCC 5710]|eukprot:CCG81817.1 putative Esterase [Taphrina deformans PYCC 5710]
MSFTTNSKIKAFGGYIYKLTHKAKCLGQLDSNVNLFLPAQSTEGKVPVLYYLGGLTCTGDNGLEKGNILGAAANNGIAVVFPDTSPRGAGIKGEDESYDFGTGAGFYLNASTQFFKDHYRMEEYITTELPSLLNSNYPLEASKTSIFGHSMGGHGALTLFLKYPGMYKSVSAFAPIANPTQCPWGEKAFTGYLGSDKEEWKKHDASELIKNFKGDFNALIDQGTGDNFYEQKQLLTENFSEAVKNAGFDKTTKIRFQPEYDHSYPSIIATFAPDHVDFHAKFLL